MTLGDPSPARRHPLGHLFTRPLVPAFLLAAGLPMAAQEPPIEPGTRVRVTAPDLGIDEYAGHFEAVESDTLAVGALRIALASVTKLEVHAGRKSNVGRGALIGAGTGAGVGIIFGALAFSEDCLFESDPCPGAGAAAGALVFGATGLVVGVVVGAFTKTDRWEEVPLQRIRVSLTPARNGGLAILASVRLP